MNCLLNKITLTIKNKYYEKFIIHHRSHTSHWLGIWRVRLQCNRIDTYFISDCSYSDTIKIDRWQRRLKINKIK